MGNNTFWFGGETVGELKAPLYVWTKLYDIKDHDVYIGYDGLKTKRNNAGQK